MAPTAAAANESPPATANATALEANTTIAESTAGYAELDTRTIVRNAPLARPRRCAGTRWRGMNA